MHCNLRPTDVAPLILGDDAPAYKFNDSATRTLVPNFTKMNSQQRSYSDLNMFNLGTVRHLGCVRRLIFTDLRAPGPIMH